MINWIVTSSVLILAVAGLRFVFRGKISSLLRYALWLVVLIRLLLPFEFGASELSLLNVVEEVPQVQEIQRMDGMDYLYYRDDGSVGGWDSWTETGGTIAENKTETEFHRMEAALTFMDFFNPARRWGILLFLFLFLGINTRFRVELESSRRKLEPADSKLPVYVSDYVETPCLFGLLEPAIYVTPEAAEDSTMLRHTIEHETTHYLHKDHIWSYLRCLALCLHWYNPLVWWAAGLSKHDSELACDEETLKRLGEGERHAYGKTLIEMTRPGRNVLLGTATTMTGSKGSLNERIQQIVKKPKMAAYTLIAVLIIAAAAAVCTLTGPKTMEFQAWLAGIEPDSFYAQVHYEHGTESKGTGLLEEEEERLSEILGNLNRTDFRQKKPTDQSTGYYMMLAAWTEDSRRLEAVFHVIDEDTLCVAFDDEAAEVFCRGGNTWYIESAELAGYILNLVDAQGTVMMAETELMRADVDRDGAAEVITVKENLGHMYRLAVSEADGTLIWEDDNLAWSHPGWCTYLLYEKDGLTAMVRYTPYASTGFATYTYEIFTLEEGRENILQENQVSFELDKPESYPEGLEAFILEVNEVMDFSSVIFSTENGDVMMGPASPEKFQNDNIAFLMEPIDLSLLAGQNLPEAALNYARDYVQAQVEHHNEIGNIISAARITALEPISTGTAALNSGINMYRLEYRLLPEHPDRVMLAGGMSMDGDEITEKGSTGQPYILLFYQHGADGTIWTRLAVTNTDAIQFDYSTPEMLQEYGNCYTAAAMELWEAFYYNLPNPEPVNTEEPSAAVTDLFDYSDHVFLGIGAAYNTYIVDGQEYREVILPQLKNFRWTKLEDYDSTDSKGVTLTSGDSRRELRFWSDGVVEYRRAGESFFWEGEPIHNDEPSITEILEEKYYDVDTGFRKR